MGERASEYLNALQNKRLFGDLSYFSVTFARRYTIAVCRFFGWILDCVFHLQFEWPTGSKCEDHERQTDEVNSYDLWLTVAEL